MKTSTPSYISSANPNNLAFALGILKLQKDERKFIHVFKRRAMKSHGKIRYGNNINN